MVTIARFLVIGMLELYRICSTGYSCFLKFISPLGKIPVSYATTGYECVDLMVSAACTPELIH